MRVRGVSMRKRALKTTCKSIVLAEWLIQRALWWFVVASPFLRNFLDSHLKLFRKRKFDSSGSFSGSLRGYCQSGREGKAHPLSGWLSVCRTLQSQYSYWKIYRLCNFNLKLKHQSLAKLSKSNKPRELSEGMWCTGGKIQVLLWQK